MPTGASELRPNYLFMPDSSNSFLHYSTRVWTSTPTPQRILKMGGPNLEVFKVSLP